MIRLTSIVVVLFLSTACVGKGKYNDAVAEMEEIRAQAAKDNAQAAAIESDQNAQIHALEREKSEVDSQLADANKALEEAYTNLAMKAVEAGQLASNVAEMEEALLELEMRRARSEANLQSYRDLVGKFQDMIDAGTLKVKVIDGRMIVELATDILFPPGAASLSKEGKGAVSEVAQVLASIPDRQYQIAGHTDNVPIASERFPSNWHLGSARAIAVTKLLIKSGLGADRVSAASFAENRPVDTNRTREGKANNRRIEIVMVPDLSTLPGYDELKRLSAHGDDVGEEFDMEGGGLGGRPE